MAEVLGSVGARRVGALAAYDAQLRDRVPELLPSGVTVERDGPLLRFLGLAGRGFVVYRDMGGLEGAELDELISRQVEVFAERGEPFEWKPHGHDLPNDLSQRLHAAGFVQEETETIVIAPRGRHRGRRGATARGRFAAGGDEPRRLRTDCGLEQEVWGDDDQRDWLVDMLASERTFDARALTIVVAEAVQTVVCAAWIRFEHNTELATLWGGATLPQWPRRGIYRASVAHRARLAAERGFRYLQTDASDDSRRILERLGFTAVTTTTPYVWSPPTNPTAAP